MTTMVTELVTDRLPGSPAAALVLPVDALITAFLVGLLVLRLLVRARQRPGSRWGVHPIDVAAVPMLFAFAALSLARILEIMPLG